MIYKPGRSRVGMNGIGKVSKLRIWGIKAAEVCCASLCGVLVSLGLLAFAENGVDFLDRGNIVRGVLFAAFALISMFGIYGRPRLMPKAFFALSQMAAAFLLPADRYSLGALLVLSYPALLILLLFGVRWKGARLAAVPLTLMLAFGMPSHRATKPLRGIPESVYLPASLASERPGGWILVFGDSVPEDILDTLAHRDGWLQMDSPKIALDFFLKWKRGMRIEVAIAGDVGRFTGAVLRRGVYDWLVGKLAPDGVLVMPLDETTLLPPGDWHFAMLPGGWNEWVASRRGGAVCVDPDALDERLRDFSRDMEQPVLPDGAISAMYPPAVERAAAPPRQLRVWGNSWQWGALSMAAAAWLLFRLLFCRRAYMGTAAAAAETAAAMTLYSLAMLPKWSSFMLDTGVMPTALFAGVGLLLLPRPFAAVRGGVRKLMQLGIGILPWLPGCGNFCWLPLVCWFFWFLAGAAVFTGLRAEDRRAALIGAVCGAVAGAAVQLLIGSGGTCLPLCAAVLLMIPLSQRR